MLGSAKGIGFVQVAETERARRFYEGTLGLKLRDDGFALVADLAGGRLRITTLPGYVATGQPVFGFELPDFDAVVDRLLGSGLRFERYDFLGDAIDANGVWTGPDGTRVAWFKDPDGNLLSITTPVA